MHPTTVIPRTKISNVVLFGATGVGKSSLINLIAGETLAATSNDALGCTQEHHCYDVSLTYDDADAPIPESKSVVTITLWDTPGLDEGTHGAVPAATSATHLKSLLDSLARLPSGVHLLLFCTRGTERLTGTQVRQYNLVYDRICRRKVPIILVVTGLEHLHPYEPAAVWMEHWWKTHAEEVGRLGMVFDAHACVTTVEGAGPERRSMSQRRLQDLIVAFTRPGTVPWRLQPSWRSVLVSTAFRILHVRRTLRSNGKGRSGTDAETSAVRRFGAMLRRWFALVVEVISSTSYAVLQRFTR